MSPADFLDALRAHYGDEAALARHELYFLSRRSRAALYLRSALAAIRDAWFCLRLPAHSETPPGLVAVVSLAAGSGRQALSPCLLAFERRAMDCALLIHPRLRGRVAGSLPRRPGLADWRHALRALRLRFADTTDAPVGPWPVRCGLFRQRLWRAAWQRTLAGGAAGGVLLLHNDFELFSVAAIEAGRGRWRSLCVQHGLPTDEFAPPRAERQLVWGDSSLRAYRALGFPAHTLLRGPARARSSPPDPERAPAAVCIVSQSHTPIFGRSLRDDFPRLAQRLRQELAEHIPLSILLHPEEARSGHPYRGALRDLCRRPPHALLSAPAAPCLVIGFCSTALLDAACLGHLVIGLDWPVAASRAALLVGQPEQRAADAEALLAMIEALLADAELRRDFLRRQAQWLQRTFRESDDWLAWIGQRP